MAVTNQEKEPKIATIKLYDDEIIKLPWEKIEDMNMLSHEITESEASRLIGSYCEEDEEIFYISNIPLRCGGKSGCQKHKIRVSEECAWPPPHMLASIAFGCGIPLIKGWLTFNADQCWCLLRNVHKSDLKKD